MRYGNHAGRDGGRRTAARTAGDAGGVPGVRGWRRSAPTPRREPCRTPGCWSCRGSRTRPAAGARCSLVMVGDVAVEIGRPFVQGHALDFGREVLDEDRHSGERQVRVHLLGRRQGTLRVEVDHRVQHRVELLDPGQCSLDQVNGPGGPVVHQVRLSDRVVHDQFLVHDCPHLLTFTVGALTVRARDRVQRPAGDVPAPCGRELREGSGKEDDDERPDDDGPHGGDVCAAAGGRSRLRRSGCSRSRPAPGPGCGSAWSGWDRRPPRNWPRDRRRPGRWSASGCGPRPAAGYLDYDADDDTFTLSDEAAAALVHGPGLAMVAACVEMLGPLVGGLDRYVAALWVAMGRLARAGRAVLARRGRADPGVAAGTGDGFGAERGRGR